MINLTFFSRSLKERCCGNRLLARIGEKWHAPPSFCALAFHNGREDRNKDVRTSAPPKTLYVLQKSGELCSCNP